MSSPEEHRVLEQIAGFLEGKALSLSITNVECGREAVEFYDIDEEQSYEIVVRPI